MLYVRTQLNDQIDIKIDLYEDQIFSTCPLCGREEQVETDVIVSILSNGADFAGTNIYCNECTKEGRWNDK